MIAFDFDRRQYKVLLDLLGTLGSRRELTSQFGLDSNALGIAGGLFVLMGGFVGLIAAVAHPPAREFQMFCLGITAVLLIPLLVSEAADAFLNPAEVSVLAHRPIGGATYVAAKATYVIKAALAVALPLNLLPALAGLTLPDTRWFYPITHAVATLIAAMFTAFLTCGVFGVLFRVVPVAKVRSAALWIQIVAVTMGPVAPHAMRVLRIAPNLDSDFWSVVPVTWFAFIGLAGHAGRPILNLGLALPAMAVALAAIAIGARSLTQGYMTRVSTIVRTRRPTTRRARATWLHAPLRWLAGGPAGLGAAVFVATTAVRDWQFRRQFLRIGVALVALPAILGASRFASQSPVALSGSFRPIHLMPHVMGLLIITICQFLAYTDHYRARWIFQTMPASGLRGIVRGTYAALLTFGVLPPHLILFAAGSILWGVSDAAIFAAYSVAVAWFYLGAGFWLTSGIPFTKQPDQTQATAAAGSQFVFMALAGILAVIQAFVIFRHVWAILVATLVFSVAAWLTARVSFRILENRVRRALETFVEGPRRMFGAVSNDAS